MRYRLTDRLFLRIQEHDYMQPKGVNFMQLERCKKPYEIIENILLNVAAKNGIKWLELLHTDYNQTELFAELCVAVILIDTYLYDIFDMSQSARLELVGYQFSYILDQYYENVNKK